MWSDSYESSDLAEMFELAEGGPVAGVSADRFAAIVSGGRRRRRALRVASTAPIVIASVGLAAGGVALASTTSHPVNRLHVKPAASSTPSAAPSGGCDQPGAGHYLVAAEIPAGLGDRTVAAPTAEVPIDLSWPSAAAGGASLDFRVTCENNPVTTGTATPVDINGAKGEVVHDGSTTTVTWSPQQGYQISYGSTGASGGPIADGVLIAMARAVPTAD